ncbi:MAG: BMP family ABC transporter substrate-binding protein, partial [Spirochaetota bacterium]|nr:BMP family ABC transporter substrate-binding protein [Spirochaetota bacterium]
MHTGNNRGRRFSKWFMYGTVFITMALVLALGLSGCGEKTTVEGPEGTRSSEEAAAEEPFDIAVFIPGVLAGSPLYQMLADGVTQAVDAHDQTTVKIVEGGFNQAEWQDKVTELAAAEKYELIVSSNPALPEICARVSENFPQQKFLLFDGHLEGNDSIYTFRYNQYEQAFLAGHMAGLVTTNGMPGANPELKIGLIAGQEYPDMNQAIKPGFLAGA